MTRDTRLHLARRVRGGVRAVLYFLLVSFVVTSSILLFVHSMKLDMAILRRNAALTLLNVMLLTAVFCLIDKARRYLLVDRPLRRILDALERLSAGKLDARVAPIRGAERADEFALIAEGINRMAQELSQVETLRTDFIANVSHELKTPLAAIANYATLLQSRELSESERMENAKALCGAAQRLSGLIGDILRLSRLENPEAALERSRYDLSEQLCACLFGMEEAIEAKGLALIPDIEEHVAVTGDASLLMLVWNNLLSNAVKFTPEGGSVRVSLHREGKEAVVRVEDTGCGMSETTRRHMFDKFYQGDTSHATQGNGLGLALAKRIVDLSGGTIAVWSEPGKGSALCVRIGEGGE